MSDISINNTLINPNRGLTTNSKNVHLDYGELIHTGLATYFYALQDGISKETAHKMAKDKLKDEFVAKNIEHKVKTLEAAVLFLSGVADLNLQDEGDILNVEEMYHTTLPSGVIYRGKIDLLLQTEKEKIVIDWKTKGRLPSAYFHHISLDRQLKGYSMLVEAQRCDLVILHCITKPQIYRHSSTYEGGELNLWWKETNAISLNIEAKLKFAQIYYNEGKFDGDMPTWNELFPRAATVCQTWGCKFFSLCCQGEFKDVVIDTGIFGPKKPQNGSSDSGSKDNRFVGFSPYHPISPAEKAIVTALAISHSQINTFHECPASFFWQYAFPWNHLLAVRGDNISVLEP